MNLNEECCVLAARWAQSMLVLISLMGTLPIQYVRWMFNIGFSIVVGLISLQNRYVDLLGISKLKKC